MSVQKIHRGPKPLESADIKITQRPSIVIPGLGEELNRTGDSLSTDQPDLRMSYIDNLAFGEEAVRILIHRGQEKASSKTTDYIAVNGTPAEILFRNGWVPMGYLPKGVAFTTKRKYVAVIASSRIEGITTTVIERDKEDPNNVIERTLTSPLPFVVLEDANPRGAEWLQGVGQRSI